MLNRTPGGGAELRQSPGALTPGSCPPGLQTGPPFSLALSPNEGRARQALRLQGTCHLLPVGWGCYDPIAQRRK